jgi:hypothetical protein
MDRIGRIGRITAEAGDGRATTRITNGELARGQFPVIFSSKRLRGNT